MKKRIVAIILCLVLIIIVISGCGPKATAGTEIMSENDLKNMKVGVIAGSKSELYAQKYTENGCEIIALSSRTEISESLANGEIDCAVMDENHARQFVAHNDFCEIKSEPFGEEAIAFSMLQSNKVYQIMLNKAIAALRADGTLDAIVEGYLNDPTGYNYEFSEKLDNGNGSFSIAIDPSMYPYVFPVDETHSEPFGIELAVIDAVCRYIGCDYSLLTLTTLSLSTALRVELADFAIGSYNPQNEYGEAIVETEPILTYGYVIVVKK